MDKERRNLARFWEIVERQPRIIQLVLAAPMLVLAAIAFPFYARRSRNQNQDGE